MAVMSTAKPIPARKSQNQDGRSESSLAPRLEWQKEDQKTAGDKQRAARVHGGRGLEVRKHGDDRLGRVSATNMIEGGHPRKLTAMMPNTRLQTAVRALPVPR